MSTFEKTNLSDSSGNTINPVTDETVILLRRMVKLMESQGIIDTAQRQRIAVDTMVALPANQSVAISRIVSTAADASIGPATAGSLRVVLASDSQIDNTIAQMRMAYDTLRSRLTFN